ncbi:MAG: DUF4259 domain-containing protein [Cyanobacteria bacterium HKST-UBA02]|nr:DUF4259 domain-containing protein [Cyanobacteria bacterium HKST-UBA02]
MHRSNPVDFIRKTLEEAVSYPDDESCTKALAAAELVASSLDQLTPQLPDHVVAWLANNVSEIRAHSQTLRASAIEAVAQAIVTLPEYYSDAMDPEASAHRAAAWQNLLIRLRRSPSKR